MIVNESNSWGVSTEQPILADDELLSEQEELEPLDTFGECWRDRQKKAYAKAAEECE